MHLHLKVVLINVLLHLNLTTQFRLGLFYWDCNDAAYLFIIIYLNIHTNKHEIS